MKFREQRLGTQAVFLLPSLKLKEPASEGVSYESRLHAFLLDHFGGYTAQAGNIFGYWRSEGAADSTANTASSALRSRTIQKHALSRVSWRPSRATYVKSASICALGMRRR